MAADLQSALIAARVHLNVVAEPRGVEPRKRILDKLLTLNITQTSLVLCSLNRNFQSSAYANSAKVPFLFCGRGRIRTYSAAKQQIYSLPRLSNFVALPKYYLAEAEGFEPSEPFGFGTLAVCWFQPLTHTSFLFTLQR